MPTTPLNTIYSWFETGDIPTQAQFQQTFSSFVHKDENIPILKVEGLEFALNNKLGSGHTSDTNAHAGILAKLDAANLTTSNVNSWKTKLGVGSLPSNMATVDDTANGLTGNVFTKTYIQNMYMAIADYVLNGKIRADKIEALGLTELITAAETSLTSFMANNAGYQFEKNDFIAIPISGNYSLYLFKGGDKTVSANYLPTGLSNITIAMVEGLQDALSGKMDKPASDGSYFTRRNAGVTTHRVINPTASYLTVWNGNDFTASPMFTDGTKIGMGTTTPTEQLQLMGRLRTQALVLDENSEAVPYQITYNSRKFFGTDSTGSKRPFMFKDFADYKSLWTGLTDAEKTEIKTIANGGWTTATMSVGLISPPIINKNLNSNTWIALKGANLNLPPVSFGVQIMDEAGTVVMATVPNAQVQLYQNGIDLTFYYNFNNLANGNYKIRLWNGVAYYVTSLTIQVTDTLQAVNLGLLDWNTKTYNDAASPVIYGDGSLGRITPDAAVKPLAEGPEIIASVKSNTLFGNGKDFYLRFNVSYNDTGTTNANAFIGLITANTPNSLGNNNFLNVIFDSFITHYTAVDIKFNGQGVDVMNTGVLGNINVTIIRRGVNYSVIIETLTQGTKFYSITNTTEAVALCLSGTNSQRSYQFSVAIQEAYILN